MQAFWAIATSLGASVWFEFVRSEANVADMPSRDDFAFLHERLHRLIPGSAKAVRRDVVLPPIDSWRSIEEALAFGLDARKRA